MPNAWVEYAAQSMAHALVAALAVEALLRVWRARAPDDRLALRALALCQPLAVTPAVVLLVPQRASEQFHDAWALFASRRWEELQVAGVSLLVLGVVAGAALGLALFLMDLVPLLSSRRRALPPASEAPPELAAALAEVARGTVGARLVPARGNGGGRAPALGGGQAPALHFVESRDCLLFCAGAVRPVLVVSRGALDLLDGEELRAALAHELAHVRRRDPALSWLLMGVRGVLFFNPVVQVVARALARGAEWSADERAGGDRLALASAVVKLHRAGLARAQERGPAALPLAAALAEPLRRIRSHDVEARCRRLLEPAAPPRLAFPSLRVALASASLGLLTFLVT
jgi:Zn-dependent protease with chaperone function